MELEELKGLDVDHLSNLPYEDLTDLLRYADDLAKYRRFNRVEYYQPYEWQRRFMDAGRDNEIRFLRAGNRTGKTHTAAAEMSYHLTGRYPPGWKGKVIQDAGHIFWVVGITLQSVCDVCQLELLGTNDVRMKDLLGTGTIPKDCIVTDQGLIPDGGKVRQIQIRHISGRLNTLKFFGSENVAIMMGAKVAGIWLDEESYNGIEVYTQCKTRTINALGKGKNGILFITATPERGMTPLNILFEKGQQDGVLYLQSASWDDCPHFTPEQIKKELASFPEWQRAMRKDGLPVLGTGAIFSVDDGKIKAAEITPLPHWRVVAAMDDGRVVDPVVVMIALHDPDNDKYYILKEFYIDGDVNDKSPRNVADIILSSPFNGVPLVIPHDMGQDSSNPEARGKLLKTYGVNVEPVVFRNPSDVELEIQHVARANRSNRAVEPGLMVMRQMFEDERLKIHESCENWFREKSSYFYKQNPNTGRVDRSGADHAIDASRYAIMSLLAGKGCLWSQVADKSYQNVGSFTAYTVNF